MNFFQLQAYLMHQQQIKGHRNLQENRDQPERSKREDSLNEWRPPKEECFHNYEENTDSYRYYSKRGCRCKRDAVL